MKKFLLLILTIFISVSCMNEGENTQLLEWKEEVDSLNTDLMVTQSANDKMSDQINELQEIIETQSQLLIELEKTNKKLEPIPEDYVYTVPYISNWKYPQESGLMRYIGDIGIRAMPSYNSPIIFSKDRLYEGNEVIMCTAVIATGQKNDGPKWGVVTKNEYGIMISGYVPYVELELIERPDIEYVESLGGFHLGDRIEKIIGSVDREYKIISDEVCMYTFPEENFGPGASHMQAMNNDIKTIDAFVSDEFRVYYLRTDSSMYELSSGYKVGDNAKEVIEYYSSRYKESELHPMESWGDYEYSLSETENITFWVDTSELNEESKISVIMIH